MGIVQLSLAEDRWGSDHCACLTGSDVSYAISVLVGPFSPEVTKSRDRKRPCPALLFSPHTFFPYFFVRTFCFPYFFFKFFPVLIPPPYFFSCIFFYRNFFPVLFFSTYFFSRIFFTVLFFPVLFSRTFSKVATFEIQRIKISVSCFFITCRYNTVHIPCRISIQTSPVGLPLDGWRARMRDLKGSKMNLFNLKEDWNVF
jgi:hypothetical protein